jgi:hypothetical protein
MSRERLLQVLSAIFILCGAALIILAVLQPINGVLSLPAALCFIAALACTGAAYRRNRRNMTP